ncbi:hypothetical protein BDY19DRAFT_603398 [Irpex rosettiformis]|uniref:Uncharacterized protein n=1 Tax=Irpex rosettiformis TaxID=378272 RepID=A0ACB8TPE3_9APHY|nr:hypothetical protein BDY19DRAFT_603398 [Irpex rosettiformis]
MGLRIGDILNNPDIFNMDDGHSILDLPEEDYGESVQFRINWPGYDEWTFTSYVADNNSLWGQARARAGTKRQLAVTLAAAVQIFHEESLGRTYRPDNVGGAMIWHMSLHYFPHLVLRQLRYCSPRCWEIEVLCAP